MKKKGEAKPLITLEQLHEHKKPGDLWIGERADGRGAAGSLCVGASTLCVTSGWAGWEELGMRQRGKRCAALAIAAFARVREACCNRDGPVA